MKHTTLFILAALALGFTANAQSTFPTNGNNVGIGTTSPAGRLEINSDGFNPGLLVTANGVSYRDFRTKNSTNGKGWQWSHRNTSEGDGFEAWHNNGTTWTRVMSITTGGSVTIGTSNSAGSFKLAVEGKIGAREVNVTTTSPWPDFVFAPEYKLRSLNELESYVEQNLHLPEVPTENEVQKNGIDLGEMNALLLKKIEELTLYVIATDKEMAELRKQVVELKSAIETAPNRK